MWMMEPNPVVSDLTFQVAGDTYGFADYEFPVDFDGHTVMFGGVLFDPIVCSMPAALCWSLVFVVPLALVALTACVVAMWRHRLRAR